MKLTVGKHELEMGGKYLGAMRDSNAIMGDAAALKARIAEEGYLLLRGVHNTDKVRAVRDKMLANLAENCQLDPNAPIDQGAIGPEARGAFLGGNKAQTRSPEFLNLVEAPEIMGFFGDFLEGDVLTFDFKWLRVIGKGDFSGAHYDVVYMGRGTHDLYTCWTPITDVPYAMGPLIVLSGSNEYGTLKDNYAEMDVDRDHVTGAFSDDATEMVDRFGGKWMTTEYTMGDAVIFGMHTMHGSATNTSNRFRLSCDCRYQRADQPVDERWVGENPIAHYAWTKGETVTMADARAKWKV